MSPSQTPSMCFEDRKVLKLIERIEKQKQQADRTAPAPKKPNSDHQISGSLVTR